MDSIDQVLVCLRRVIRATDLHSKYLVKTSGYTAPQILVLRTIGEQGPVTIGEIAKQVNLSQATVTTIIDRLVIKQMVYRERSNTDRRKVFAFLTEAGAEVVSKAPTPLQDRFAQRFERLEQWEQSMMLASLQRVATMMDADDIDAAPLLDLGSPERNESATIAPIAVDHDKIEVAK